ncbi:uncharacterized protein BDR25DRAFT_228047 [Lindgomyces ingoldianus]|uniref:Uncharacterized protein n=1 Tax=Lindgomyces ingoldianus TaxID=673940 RepID=A0ACB6QRL3_9PLEO|nr:uncharacterized protein BDR25DRAFT_228047 [Lindgomyces ingoldianus]KAF2469576.1 hypothetical protein BDR25DRAFT_228047 [Lindgomyces ingoldianus]
MAILASTYWNQGRWDAAEELEVQVIEIRKKNLGADHPSTLTSMNNLAFTRKGQGRDVEAISLMKECVRLQRHTRGVNNSSFVAYSNVLAKWEKVQVDDCPHSG